MSYATFSQAKSFVSAGYGSCDPAVLGEVVNAIRHQWYLWYESLPLFLDAVSTFQVHRFCGQKGERYRGVTLPRDFQTVEAMWVNGFPVELQSSWREFQTGIATECDCGLEKFDVPGFYSTAVDHRPGMKVKVLATNGADVGKRFVIRGTDIVDRPFSQEFELSMIPQATTLEMNSIGMRGGIVKDVTIGRVVLAEEDGSLLSTYEPDETVPAYKRIKITGFVGDCDQVNIRAARRYFPLYSDDDVVETDNAPAFDAMARYLVIYRKRDKTRDEIADMGQNLTMARAFMGGGVAREVGKGTQAQLKFVSPRINSHALRGRRR